MSAGVLCKVKSQPEYAVGFMAASLEAAIRPLEWEVTVERKGRAWLGVGVAVRDVALNQSLRQTEKGAGSKQGKAWFYHDRGFLCDGERIVDDQIAPYAWSGGGAEGGGCCSIGVVFDLSSARLRFKVNGVLLPGEINDVRGQDLHPVVYCNGEGTKFTCTSLPRQQRTTDRKSVV